MEHSLDPCWMVFGFSYSQKYIFWVLPDKQNNGMCFNHILLILVLQLLTHMVNDTDLTLFEKLTELSLKQSQLPPALNSNQQDIKKKLLKETQIRFCFYMYLKHPIKTKSIHTIFL